MTKQELIEKLKVCELDGDNEAAHEDADALLLEFIDDEDIDKAFKAVEKWYD